MYTVTVDSIGVRWKCIISVASKVPGVSIQLMLVVQVSGVSMQ